LAQSFSASAPIHQQLDGFIYGLPNKHSLRKHPMRIILWKVIPFLALASVFAAAQRKNPPDPAQMAQHRVDFLTRHLSLNAQQQQQATTIYTEAANNARSFHDQMRTAHQNLQTAVQKNDMAAIEQGSNTIGNLMAQMTAAHAKADAAFYQTLTPEQQAKMKEIESHHGPGMHGHGGPEGPPPGV
jgi:Spy/CpxP family protein refolding chaperone